MSERDQPPDEGESEPREDEGESESEESPSPLSVDERREHILEEAQPPLGDFRLEYIALSILVHGSAPRPSRDSVSVRATPATKNTHITIHISLPRTDGCRYLCSVNV